MERTLVRSGILISRYWREARLQSYGDLSRPRRRVQVSALPAEVAIGATNDRPRSLAHPCKYS